MGFNLVIEMLFISGLDNVTMSRGVVQFQSRNRDAFHFRAAGDAAKQRDSLLFQSRNRDACHFRFRDNLTRAVQEVILFQSRNRDACHFRL